MARIVFAFIVFLLPIEIANGETVFVDPEVGNDSWTGSQSSPNASNTDGPVRTIAAALGVARSSRLQVPSTQIRIELASGRYELAEPLVLTGVDSGTLDAPTIIAARSGCRPVISGGKLIDGWKLESKGIWAAELVPGKFGPDAIRHIRVNGKMGTRSRWPQTGFFTIKGLAGADAKAPRVTPTDRFEYSSTDIDHSWPDLNSIEVVVLHFWIDSHFLISSVDVANNIVQLDRKSLFRLTDDYTTDGAPYYLLNVGKALRKPGEFQHDLATNRIRYCKSPEEDLSKSAVVIPQLTQLLKLVGCRKEQAPIKSIVLQGIEFADTNWNPLSNKDIGTQAGRSVPAAIQLEDAEHCRFENCKFSTLATYAVEIGRGCSENEINDCTFAYCGGGGVKVIGDPSASDSSRRTGGNKLSNNLMHHLGKHFHQSVGILLIHTDHNVVAHNHIHDLDYTAISVGLVWGFGPNVSTHNQIENNLIHDIGNRVLSDMGGIYTLGVSPGTVVTGNVIHNVNSRGYGGWGIYSDEGSSDIVFSNNLVYENKTGGFHQHKSRNLTIDNNIFALNGVAQIVRSIPKSEGYSLSIHRNILVSDGQPFYSKNADAAFDQIDSNLYWNRKPAAHFAGGELAAWQSLGLDVNSIVADPRLKRTTKGVFRLAPDSPAEKIGFIRWKFEAAGVERRGNNR